MAQVNLPQTYYVGLEDLQPGKLYITLGTHEVNRDGNWTLVQRTVFLFREKPFYTTDIVAPSSVTAPSGHGNRLTAPAGIEYQRPADIGAPLP